MRIVGVIPARLGSTRFPGKPLAKLLGRSMVEHVYRRAAMCRALSETVVATCDREIAREVERFGGRAVMTSARHERATDRAAEAARKIRAGICVMVQGDEPMVVPSMIEEALGPFRRNRGVVCSNLAAWIRSRKEFEDPNTIKAVMAENGDALYFSREPIPSPARLPFGALRAFKQVCVIGFRRDFLLRFARLEPTPLEKAESIDMLRALEHGYPVRLVPTSHETHAVDTPRDLRLVERLMRRDPLAPLYAARPRP